MITQTSCTIFGLNLLKGLENFTSTSPYVYKIALYNANANLGNTTTAYTSVNEVTGTGYTAGGQVLTPILLGSDNTNNTAFVSFSNVIWSPASFTTRGALIYNSTTGAAVFVLNFGSDKTPSNSFTVTFPTADSTNAIIRIT
jgi:hypothetical protein